MNQSSAPSSGILYIVATPIGNLEDITVRALRILKECDYIAAEDTRHTRKLLNHYGISAKLISYYREKEQQRADDIVNLLREGHSIALVTDAGTPAVSDPGAVLVNRCMEEEIHVTPIPGASALTTALSCAGIQDGAITFYGFIPAKSSQRKKIFQSLQFTENHCVFYESPRRVLSFLEDAFATWGDREIFIGRELTKSFEDIRHTSLQKVLASPDMLNEKGEYVIIIHPASAAASKEMDLDEQIRWYRGHTELSLKDCSKAIAEETGLAKSIIYKRALLLWDSLSQDDEAEP